MTQAYHIRHRTSRPLPEHLYNPYMTPELCFRFHYFAMRDLRFLLRTRALTASPADTGHSTNCLRP